MSMSASRPLIVESDSRCARPYKDHQRGENAAHLCCHPDQSDGLPVLAGTVAAAAGGATASTAVSARNTRAIGRAGCLIYVPLDRAKYDGINYPTIWR